MKVLYTSSLFLFLIVISSSCSFRMRSINLSKNTPNYTAYNNGDTVYTNGTIRKALVEIPVKERIVSETKTDKSFSVFDSNGKEYNGYFYGKLNLLMSYGGYGYSMSSGGAMRYTPTYKYYLQKRGENKIYPLSSKNLQSLVADNQLALRKAKASSIYNKVAISSMIVFIGGITSSIFIQSELRSTLVNVGLTALPVSIISLPLSAAKKKKVFYVYDNKH